MLLQVAAALRHFFCKSHQPCSVGLLSPAHTAVCERSFGMPRPRSAARRKCGCCSSPDVRGGRAGLGQRLRPGRTSAPPATGRGCAAGDLPGMCSQPLGRHFGLLLQSPQRRTKYLRWKDAICTDPCQKTIGKIFVQNRQYAIRLTGV